MRTLFCFVFAISLAVAGSASAVTWTLSSVDGTTNSGNMAAMRLDTAGLPHVAYWTAGTGIRLATFDGATWTYATFPGPYEPVAAPAHMVPGVPSCNATG